MTSTTFEQRSDLTRIDALLRRNAYLGFTYWQYDAAWLRFQRLRQGSE